VGQKISEWKYSARDPRYQGTGPGNRQPALRDAIRTARQPRPSSEPLKGAQPRPPTVVAAIDAKPRPSLHPAGHPAAGWLASASLGWPELFVEWNFHATLSVALGGRAFPGELPETRFHGGIE
jgi:hypothetical protein